MRRFLSLASVSLFLSACATFSVRYAEPGLQAVLQKPLPPFPKARFAVLSDTHVFPVELGVEGAAFQDYINNDRKLLKESQEIMRAARDQILAEKPDFVLVSGDLTKDAEREGHEWFAGVLDELAAAGIPSFVVPGNHDINNPKAVRFIGAETERVPTVSPEEFAQIYARHGYGTSLERDPGSLSYLAEPVPGLWLVAMDSCVYDTNFKDDYPFTGGRYTQARLDWLESVLLRAREQDKAVILMQHHTVTEQYNTQRRYFPEYVTDQDQEITALLQAYGVRLAFSGHYHAHDITLRRNEAGQTLYSVMTGSLVTYPNPYRMVAIGPEGVELETRRVTNIASYDAEGLDFPETSRQYAHDGIALIAVKTMVDLGVPQEEAESLSSSIADAFLAHYAGDENFTGTEKIRLDGLSFMGGLVVGTRKDLIEGLWNDLEPPDNRIRVLPDLNWEPLP